MNTEEDLERLLRSKIKAYGSSTLGNGAVRIGCTKSLDEENTILDDRAAGEKASALSKTKAAVSRRLPDYCYTVKVRTVKAPFSEQAAAPLSNVDARLELFATLKKTFKVFLLTSRMERRLTKLKGRVQEDRTSHEQHQLCAPPLSLLTLKLSIEKGATHLLDASSPIECFRIPPLCNVTPSACTKRTPFAFKLLGFAQAFPEFSLDLSQNAQAEQEALQPVVDASGAEVEAMVTTFPKVVSAPVEIGADPTYLLVPSNRVESLTKYDVQRGGYNVKDCSTRRTIRNLKEHSVAQGYFDPALARFPKTTMSVSRNEEDSEEDEQPPLHTLPSYPAQVAWGAAPRGTKMSDVNSTEYTVTLNTFVNTFPV